MTDVTALIVDLLANGHAVQFQARGDSMDPVIRDGDSLHVEPCDAIRRGDVVLVLAERGLTAHRVIALRGDLVITRGDNAPAEDDAVSRERVLGKVTRVVREGRPIGRIGQIGRIGRIGLIRRIRRFLFVL
jgi:phage repressor protein C with HTH and peptisase S24 domain